MINKPTVLEFTTINVQYALPDYALGLSDAIDDAWVIYSDQINLLTESKQQLAFKYAVCHMFALACWEAQGFNSAPVEMSSRNESVRFNGKGNFLSQTMCGRKLLQLLKQKQNAIYGSNISAPRCNNCYC